jgi:hypothetical protein
MKGLYHRTAFLKNLNNGSLENATPCRNVNCYRQFGRITLARDVGNCLPVDNKNAPEDLVFINISIRFKISLRRGLF